MATISTPSSSSSLPYPSPEDPPSSPSTSDRILKKLCSASHALLASEKLLHELHEHQHYAPPPPPSSSSSSSSSTQTNATLPFSSSSYTPTLSVNTTTTTSAKHILSLVETIFNVTLDVEKEPLDLNHIKDQLILWKRKIDADLQLKKKSVPSTSSTSPLFVPSTLSSLSPTTHSPTLFPTTSPPPPPPLVSSNVRWTTKELETMHSMVSANAKLRAEVQSLKSQLSHLSSNPVSSSSDPPNPTLPNANVNSKEPSSGTSLIWNTDVPSNPSMESKAIQVSELPLSPSNTTTTTTKKVKQGSKASLSPSSSSPFSFSLNRTPRELHELQRKNETLLEELKVAHQRETKLKQQVQTLEHYQKQWEHKQSQYLLQLDTLKQQARTEIEATFTSTQLLQDKERQLKELNDQYHEVYSEKEQLNHRCLSLEHQLTQVRQEYEKQCVSYRQKEMEFERLLVEHRSVHQDVTQLKHQHQLMFASKSQLEREKKELVNQLDVQREKLSHLEQTLMDARKELQVATQQGLNQEELTLKCQKKYQTLSDRYDHLQRQYMDTQHQSESHEHQWRHLEWQYKQTLMESKEWQQKYQSLELKCQEKQSVIDQLNVQLKHEETQYLEKVKSNQTQFQHLDQSLHQLRIQHQLSIDEREDLKKEVLKLKHKLEKYQHFKHQLETKVTSLMQSKEKAEKKVKELHRYKPLYEKLLLLNEQQQQQPLSSVSKENGMDPQSALLLQPYQRLLAKCRSYLRSYQHACSSSTNSSSSSSSSSSPPPSISFSSLESIDEVLDAFDQLPPFSSFQTSTTTMTSSWYPMEWIPKDMIQCIDALNPLLVTLTKEKLLNPELVPRLQLISTVLQQLPTSSSSSSSSFPPSSSTTSTTTTSTTSTQKATNLTPFFHTLQSIVLELGQKVLSKYKSVVISIQHQLEKELHQVQHENHQLHQLNQDMKQRLAKLSCLVDQTEALRKEQGELRKKATSTGTDPAFAS